MYGPLEEHGYDAIFVSEVWDELKCAICHLVLRNPIQLMTCGHRFCEACFERMKEYSSRLDTHLVCPVDQNTIDMEKVFEDKGIARAIGNLRVKCKNTDRGCEWIGDLRNLEEHEKDCQHQEEDSHAIKGDVIKGILKRLNFCEESLAKNEKNEMKARHKLHELQQDLDKKAEEMRLLKISNMELQAEVKLNKITNLEMKKQFEDEINLLKNKTRELETRGKTYIENTENISDDGRFDESKFLLRMNSQESGGSLCTGGAELGQSPSRRSPTRTFAPLSLTIDKEDDHSEIENTNLDRSTRNNRNNDSATTTIADNTNNNLRLAILEENLAKLTDSHNSNALTKHIENLENILFAYDSLAKQTLTFKWALQNYQQHSEIGKPVYSPIFYVRVSGYCFKLVVSWSGQDKENLGVFLKLHRDPQRQEVLAPFHHEYSLQIFDNTGNGKKYKITQKYINAHRERCFSIPDRDDVAREGYGATNMIRAPFDEYIINDSLFVACTIYL